MSIPAGEWSDAEQRIAEIARTRRGRHRDKALASYRRTRAVELRAQGLGYAEIAREVGYANKGTAHKAISQALEAREANNVELLRTLELDRLDAIQAAIWDAAMAGEVRAVRPLLRIIDARCRLLGLHPDRRVKNPKARWDNCQGPSTVIVRADDCRQAGCPQHGQFQPPAVADE